MPLPSTQMFKPETLKSSWMPPFPSVPNTVHQKFWHHGSSSAAYYLHFFVLPRPGLLPWLTCISTVVLLLVPWSLLHSSDFFFWFGVMFSKYISVNFISLLNPSCARLAVFSEKFDVSALFYKAVGKLAPTFPSSSQSLPSCLLPFPSLTGILGASGW